MSFRLSRSYSVVEKVIPAVRRPGIGFLLAVLLSTFLAVAAQAQTDSGSSSSTVPTLTIGSSHVVAASSEEATFTVTASSAPSSALPVSVHVRALGLSMDTRTVADVVLPAGATTVTLRLEQVAESIAESRVDVTLSLVAGTGYSLGDASTARVSIYYPPATPPESRIESSPTPTPSASPPDAPSGVQVSATASDSLTVTWTAEAGETYQLEREAAYLFSYRVWQTVADDLSGGTYTGSELTCGSYHLFQLRAKVAGSVYGEGASVLVSARSCTRSKSDGARAVRDPSDPPKLRLVTDNPETDSIQLRLWDGDNPVSGMQKFDAERTLPRTSRPTTWPSSAVSIGQKPTRGEFRWEGLACSSSYYFRAQGQGNGVQYSTAWGPWSDVVHGSTWPCAPPTPPKLADIFTDRPTKTSILVRWDFPPPDMRFVKFKVQYRPANNPTGWVGAGSEITAGSKRVGSLTCGNSYYFQVSGKGNGSANGFANSYGPWSDEVQGSTSSCLSPPPAPSNVDASFVPDPGESMFGVQLNWGGALGAASYRIERSPVEDDSDRVTVKVGLTATTFTVPSLTCGRSFNFWVSALGNGTTHQAVYGNATKARYVPITDRSARSTNKAYCPGPTLEPSPPNLTIFPMPQRKALLSWNRDDNATGGFIVRIRKKGTDPWPARGKPGYRTIDNPAVGNPSLEITLELDRILQNSAGTDEGLAHHTAFQIQVEAVDAVDSTKNSVSEVTIVDSPIISINGDSRNAANGKMAVKLERAANRQYTIRYRKLPGDHIQAASMGNRGWFPAAATSNDNWTLVSGQPTEVTNDWVKYEVALPERRKIYAVQANYTDSATGEKYLSARERYVWRRQYAVDTY